MEISEIRLMNLANSNARAKVMVKQWYPELFKKKEEESDPLSTLRCIRVSDAGVIVDANGDELIIGEWYTDNEMHTMIYSGTSSSCKGFYDGNWGSTWSFPHPESSLPASRELVQNMLRQECINRGYNASNFLSFAGNYYRNYPIQVWYYDDVSDSMYAAPHGIGGLCMYKKGLWADINNNDTVIEVNNTPNDSQWWDF